MQNVIERVKRIILSPSEALKEVKSEALTISATMKNYVVYLAAIPAIAQFIGYAIVGLPIIGRQNIFRTLIFSILLFVLSLVNVLIVSAVINALAPTFNSVKNNLNAFKLAVYSLTPVFVAGIFNIFPSLGILALLGGLYGIYILYLGFPILMETPQDKTIAYTLTTVVVVIIVSFIVTAIATAIAWGGSLTGRYL
jgi:hypothetical protein